MKLAALLLALILGYHVWQRYKPVPPPPPSPPPPAILSEPAPVINEAEQQKILKSAQDPDANVRWEAVVLLDKMGSKLALPLLFEKLERDTEPQIRIKVIGRLTERRSKEVTRAIIDAMDDQETEVRLAALRALQQIGDYAVAGAIASGPLKDQEEQVRLQALKTLNSLQDKRQQELDEARRLYELERQKAQQEAQKSR